MFFRTIRRGGGLLALTLVALALGAGLSAPVASASKHRARHSPATHRHQRPAVRAAVRLQIGHVVHFDHRIVTVPGRSIFVAGTVAPYARGQFVKVRIERRGRVVAHGRVRLRPASAGNSGHFNIHLSVPVSGHVRLYVTHTRTRRMGNFFAHRGLGVLADRVGFGSRGDFVRLLQQRLGQLHFYLPRTGVYDSGTGLAIDAFHRLMRWGTYQTLDTRTIDALLAGHGAYHVRHPQHGRHAEVDLFRQLLILVDGSHVDEIFPVSSGKPSTPTVTGDFRIFDQSPGYAPDGMYYTSAFYGNYAIHGYDPAPDYPASHGCVRLPIPDAITVYDWLAVGDWVDVYR